MGKQGNTELTSEEMWAELQWLRTLINTVPQVIYEADTKGLFTFVNENVYAMAGYTPQEVCGGMSALDFVCPEDSERLKQNIRKILQSNPLEANEYCLLKKNGEKVEVLIKSTLKTENGVVKGLRGVITDITQLKRLEENLKQSEERFRNIFMHTTVGMYRTTPDGRILMANPALIKMLGYDSFEQLASRNLEKEGFEPDYDRNDFKREIEKYGFINRNEHVWVKKNGEKMWIRESAVLIHDINGQTYYDGTVEDISLYKQAEDKLRKEQMLLKKSQELGAIGSWQVNLITGKVKASEELIRMYRVPEKEYYTLEEFTSRIHPEDRAERKLKWEKALQEGKYNSVYRLLINGETVWINTNGEIIYNEKKEPVFIYAAVQDITAQKKAEQKMKEQAEETAAFNEAMVGRELRIIELKEEVNKLASQLGQPKPYPNIWDEKNETEE